MRHRECTENVIVSGPANLRGRSSTNIFLDDPRNDTYSADYAFVVEVSDDGSAGLGHLHGNGGVGRPQGLLAPPVASGHPSRKVYLIVMAPSVS